MMFGFLFWVFLVGIIVASLQDLKRREVDNWLNLFLILVGFSFLFFRAIFEKNPEIVFQAGFALVVLLIFMNLFYYGRVFAGGDAKLLFAMTAFFVAATFMDTLINIGIFLLFLMFSGSVYGLIYSLVLYAKDFKRINRKVMDGLSPLRVRFVAIGGIILFVLGYFNWIFLFIGVLFILLPFLYVFTKALEGVTMIRALSGKELREGDWLVDDVRVGNKTIKADWDGLSLEDIKIMRKLKKVKIKDGLPFVPAFLIAFIAYAFLKEIFLIYLASLV